MEVYHGTTLHNALDIVNNGINLNKSKEYLDFGKGFYVTPNINMANNMAKRAYANEKRKKSLFNISPTVLVFEYEENKSLNYKIFEYEDEEWAKFIISNRVTPEISESLAFSDNNKNFEYDVIIGGTADGDVASIAANLRYGFMCPKDYILNLSDFLKSDGTSYGTQYVFCTEESLSCIKYIRMI